MKIDENNLLVTKLLISASGKRIVRKFRKKEKYLHEHNTDDVTYPKFYNIINNQYKIKESII